MHVPRCVSVCAKILEQNYCSFFFFASSSYIYFCGFRFVVVVVVASVDSRSLRFIFNVYVCPIVYDFRWVFSCLIGD